MATKDTKRVETATVTEKSANFDSDMASSLIRKTTGFEILGTSISGFHADPEKSGGAQSQKKCFWPLVPQFGFAPD